MEDQEINDLLKNYQKILQLAKEHASKCDGFRRKLLSEFGKGEI